MAKSYEVFKDVDSLEVYVKVDGGYMEIDDFFEGGYAYTAQEFSELSDTIISEGRMTIAQIEKEYA